MLSTPRDIDITVCGLLKSVIESGAAPELWDERLMTALKIQNKYTKLLNAQLAKKEAPSNGNCN